MKALGAIGMGIAAIMFMASLILWAFGDGEFTTVLAWLAAVTASSFVYHIKGGTTDP